MDKQAKNILIKTYWSSAGWKEVFETDQIDFEYAKSKGLMFDPIKITIEEVISKLHELLSSISQKTITDAFLCSLTNKRLDWRSSLASYANAKRVVEGIKIPEDDWAYYGKDSEDINILNFERIKWGGVRHYQALYNYFDLDQIHKEEIPMPASEDILIFQSILDRIEQSDTNDSPSKLRDNFKNIFTGSNNDRGTMMEILGSAGILLPTRFDRNEPGKHDWHFPLHWRGEDKYNKNNAERYFGIYGIS